MHYFKKKNGFLCRNIHIWHANTVMRRCIVLLNMMKSKIHRATITETELEYVGSISIDEELLEKAGILENEKVQVVNMHNGTRFETYAIVAPRGSGVIGLNGAAARLGYKGDKVIIIAYAMMDAEEARTHKPAVVLVDEKNRTSEIR